MFCYKCGKELPDEAAFCIKCGTNLAATKETLKTTTSSCSINNINPSTQVNKFPSWVYVLCGVGITGVLVVGGLFLVGDKDDGDNGSIQQEQSPSTDSQIIGDSIGDVIGEKAEVKEEDYEVLYAETLNIIRANADDTSLEFDDLVEVGLPYYLMFTEDNLSRMGYDFVDVNGDNIAELMIGYYWEYENEPDMSGYGLISAYTIKNGQIVPFIESGERFGYFLTKDLYFGEWGSDSAVSNMVALLKLNEQQELDYLMYINNTVENDDDWNSPVYDFIISTENNKPNFDNRRIASEQELADFYSTYEGERYQFNFTPFVNQVETTVALQNFSGTGYVDFPSYDPMETPDPSNKTGWDSVWHKGKTSENLCYYGGLHFMYHVEDGGLFITYPDCEYSFFLGYIVNPNMKDGDTLV